ncbi:helix-turn-helix domain-containing protein [Kribbella sandramycini]|uniref:Helix-turn-helix domain-containing protein n=1 Tax=Kribbella sandramycini TaxID=60450 RepID=A0A7Y4KYP0_9ACTN|nr:helix-turn-helix transcriptional regulator [Kribbella sandramycini]MBB6569047.1 transcriptional regulator with XRE-family HTH domain [Kribbella sandramycini]NOL41109.1 helix-turn-helix domain-containing protein [Kribbella sandramycini]
MGGDELGEFLRSRRAALLPADVGLPSADRRRVRGLRREEVAALAGVSSSYYTRIEQGNAGQVSPAVLRSVAAVLRLSDADSAYLLRLADPTLPTTTWTPAVRPSVRQLVHRLDIPAAILGRHIDVLAWNRAAHLVFAPDVAFDAPDSAARPNWARLLFLEPSSRSLFADWPGTARDIAGRLRISATRHPQDAELQALIMELRAASADFEALWSSHPVQVGNRGLVQIQHPLVGELVFHDELLHLADDPDCLVVTMTVEPGSSTESALRRLVTADPGDSAGSGRSSTAR